MVLNLSEFTTIEQLAASIKSMDMVTAVPWTDYSGTSTIVGWSSYSVKIIRYSKDVKQRVFVEFYITGTSDSTSTTFTLPYSNTTNPPLLVVLGIKDNGTFAVGRMTLDANSSTVTVYPTISGGSWTNSGTKEIYGQFWYEAA